MSGPMVQRVRRAELEDGDVLPADAEVLDAGMMGDSLAVWYREPGKFHLDREREGPPQTGP